MLKGLSKPMICYFETNQKCVCFYSLFPCCLVRCNTPCNYLAALIDHKWRKRNVAPDIQGMVR